ncbi:MAG: hypothetical protein KatS3mg096_122 [Candidatus Parcubacteria bacterium]|nr:MAG: hypothetical protein KatS3mg096_122 [Candidatus Parcubacteria bacterium]
MNILRALILDDLIEFLDFWFHHFPQRTIRHFFDQVYLIDKNLKVKANLRNLTKPLYGDHTIIGYLIAFPYRVLRIFFGLVIYFFIFLLYLFFVIFWVFLPIFLLGYGILLAK